MNPKASEKHGVGDTPSNQEGEMAVTGAVERFLSSESAGSHPASLEQEKRIRREVANSNERRRMQSINAGFLALRAMLPQREGEKLSKAAILQQTSDFICNLEQEKTRLLTQNCQLKRLLGPQSPDPADAPPPPQSGVARQSEEEPPEPAAPLPEPSAPLQELRMELREMRAQLERERLQRLAAEERLRQAERICLKKPRLAPPPAGSPQLVVAEQRGLTVKEEPLQQAVQPPPPPPPPVAPRRPLYRGSTTSRQNLDTIVEAIRHLEGDHLFGDCSEPKQTRLEAMPACVETIQTRLEPIQTRLEPMQTRIEPIQTRLEPIQTRLEPIQTRLEPMRVEPIRTRLEPLASRLESPVTRLEPLRLDLSQPCLDLEPQEAPLELTTHSRSSSGERYRPAVIVAQRPPLPRQ